MKEIFEDIIKNNRWKKHPCGPGSTLKYTEYLRANLGIFLEKHNIRSMIDLPCGDHSWMNLTNLPSIDRYIGGDIVGSLIAENKRKYPNKDFRILDITTDCLPDVDLLFCRDCLLHLSFKDIDKAFQNISNSDIKYILMSNWTDEFENFRDIDTGKARYINFLRDPFNLGVPIDSITDYVDGFPKRELILLPKSVIDNYTRGKK